MPSKSGLCNTQPCAAPHAICLICQQWRGYLSSILMLAGRAANIYVEAATAHVAFLPTVGQSHASRRHGREMGYFQVEWGEEVLTTYECFLEVELWRGTGIGSMGRTGEHCREDGGLAGCAGEEGESCGDCKGFWCGWGLLLVIHDTWVHLTWTLVGVSYKLHRVFPHFLIKQQVVWKWIHLRPCLQTIKKWWCAIRTFPWLSAN